MRTPLLATVFLLVLPATAWAGRQGDDYEYLRGPELQIKRPRTSASRPDLCQAYPSGGPRHACFRGADAGQRVSANYAGAQGWREGYLRGFTWGIHLGIRDFANDQASRDQGRADLKSSTLVKDAFGKLVKQTVEEAQKAGYTHATQVLDDAYAAKEQPVLELDPAAATPPEYTVPARPFEEYVGPPATPKTIMKDEMKLEGIQVWRLKDFRYVDLQTRVPPWDYYRPNGIYEFDPSPTYDSNAALEIYKKTVDRAGYPPGEVQIEDEIFQKAYKHFVEYNFADQVYTALDSGLKSGQGLGEGVGKRLAFHDARQKAFDETFTQRAPGIHANAWKKGFARGFEKKIEEAKKPILSVASLEIIPETDDGILRPGEGLKIKAVVDNKGLAPGELAANMKGNVAKSELVPIDLEAFTQTVVESGVVARVDPSLAPRSQAVITAQIEETTKTMRARVRQIVEIGLAKLGKADALNGRVLVRVGAINPSTVTAPATEIHVRLGGDIKKKLPLGQLPSKGKKAGNVKITGLDPIDLARNDLAFDVVVMAGKTKLDEKKVPILLGDPIHDLLKHFDQLANGQGWMPEGATREARLQKVTAAVVAQGKREIKAQQDGPNVWKGSPSTTLLGKLKATRTASTDGAKSAHEALNDQLCELHKSFNPVRIKKKKAYKELCSQVAKL